MARLTASRRRLRLTVHPTRLCDRKRSRLRLAVKRFFPYREWPVGFRAFDLLRRSRFFIRVDLCYSRSVLIGSGSAGLGPFVVLSYWNHEWTRIHTNEIVFVIL